MANRDTFKEWCTLIRKKDDTHFFQSAMCVHAIKNPSVNLEIGDESIIIGVSISTYENMESQEFISNSEEVSIMPLKSIETNKNYTIDYKIKKGHNYKLYSIKKTLSGDCLRSLLLDLCNPYEVTIFEDLEIKEGFTEMICGCCGEDTTALITDSSNRTMCSNCKSETDTTEIDSWIKHSSL